MGGLRSGPSLKMRGGGGVLSERLLTGKTETYIFFFKNDGLFDLPRSEKQNKELYIFEKAFGVAYVEIVE